MAYSGGIQSIGSLRNIRLLRSNGDSFVFDLYKLLIDGDRTDDITIESGDVIVIGAAVNLLILRAWLSAQELMRLFLARICLIY